MTTGSLSPATYPTDAITIRCDRCSRVGRYKRQTLVGRYGADSALPDVLNEITACERNQRLSLTAKRADTLLDTGDLDFHAARRSRR